MKRGWVGVALLALLTACGGGGGGSNGAGSAGGGPLASDSLAASCAAPRSGIDPFTGARFPDRGGSVDDEKRWLRAWIDETYLWFDEVPDPAPAAYATPVAYFDVLKTGATTASGRPKDRFHFSMASDAWQSQSQNGIAVGWGMELAVLQGTPPRDVRVAFVEPGSPAAAAGIERGIRLLAIDGVEVAAGDANALDAGLQPARVGELHRFQLGERDGSLREANLVAEAVIRSPVLEAKTLASAHGPVGYLLFNDHSEPAEAQLVAAIGRFRLDGIVELVLDMRYNGGGLLAIASQLATMVAAPAATQGKVFERLVSNRKEPFKFTTLEARMPFYDTTLGYSALAGQALPRLGLRRVTVLTGPDTCSASESVVNALRGVGVEVQLVGGTSCGKPYAFVPKDNCGTTYFAIQFIGVNEQGRADYADGFAPDCPVADDFEHALGDPAEARLAAALALREGGACPTTTALKAGEPSRKADGAQLPLLRRTPGRENRWLSLP